MKRWLTSKYFWGGAVAGAVAGGWALGTVGSVTGIRLNLPKVR